jgi:histidyl-tRNA synthetase
MDTIDLQPVKGTRDFYPEDMRLRNWLFAHWRRIALAYGYEEYDACVLESEELYVRKAGDEITGQLYNFVDKGERRVALRPEMTPTLARMVLAKGASLPLPARWFTIAQCFRYENMQRGRKREHYQWNLDVIGLATVAAEAELMAAQRDFLRAVGLITDTTSNVVFRVSNRQVIQHFLAGLGIVGEAFAAVCVVIDKRDKIGDEATAAQLAGLGVPAESAGRILKLLDLKGLAAVENAVGRDNPGYVALKELVELSAAAGMGAELVIDLGVIRGLSYYTGTVWEVFDASGDLPRAIAGGGRYDRLLEVLGGPAQPMVGFGFGDVVIAEILRDRGLLPAEALRRRVDDVVFPMGAGEFAVAAKVASNLRRQGRSVVVDYSGRRFKHAIKRAEDDGAARLLILGADEVKAGVCTVRTLGTSVRTEVRVPLSELGA